ncbi:MAG: thermonuclease family protein [Armatimonadetes bacterium]|nr:thermonuclease family protein [Armatimonadota bacterium]
MPHRWFRRYMYLPPLVLVLACVFVAAINARAPRSVHGWVLGVTDGDTLRVRVEGRTVRVRLYGIDCPELGQPFGVTARKITAGLCVGQPVTLALHGTDRYGRTLATVRTSAGNVNEALVTAGLAWWYRRYAPEASRLRALEAAARSARRGLWSQPRPVAPWTFRSRPLRASLPGPARR